LSFKKRFILHEIFRNRRKKNHLQSHQLFCDSICSLLLRINFFRSPPENGHKLWNDGVWVWQRSTDRTHQSAPIATAAKQTAASNQDILSQDIEEAVIKQTKKTQPKRNGEGRG
jgi:hypothetical protein